MVSHRALGDGLTETGYDDGRRIVVNYGREAREVEGRTVPAKGWVVLEGGRR
jgi:hypothetical protein